MNNKELVIAHIERCKTGNHGRDNCKKVMIKWLVENSNVRFKVADLADILGFSVPTTSKALYNLKRDGFKFKAWSIGPNRFSYLYEEFTPKVNLKPGRKAKVKNKVKPDSWARAMSLMA